MCIERYFFFFNFTDSSKNHFNSLKWNIEHVVSWEPERHYCHRLCTAIAPFWFSSDDVIGWEPEGCNHYSKMFCWEPEGRYRHRLCMSSNSTLLVLNGALLNSDNALLALNWRCAEWTDKMQNGNAVILSKILRRKINLEWMEIVTYQRTGNQKGDNKCNLK